MELLGSILVPRFVIESRPETQVEVSVLTDVFFPILVSRTGTQRNPSQILRLTCAARGIGADHAFEPPTIGGLVVRTRFSLGHFTRSLVQSNGTETEVTAS
jgi:hypothetical protein